jgi:DNA-binding MarR family transcriptional regulator
MLHDREKLISALVRTFPVFKPKTWGHFADLPVNPGQMMVLHHLKHYRDDAGEGIKQSRLSASMNLAPCTLTLLLNALEKEGYISRSHSQADRRVVFVKLTGKGEEIFAHAHEMFTMTVGALVDYLGQEDSAELVRLLGRLREFFESGHGNVPQHTERDI